MEYALETISLCKHYKKFKALNNLNMHVPKGTIYGFVGKNGAGKTTLIRLATGLQNPTTGTFKIFGCRNDEKRIVKMRRRIGAVVETPSIYMDLSASDNMKAQFDTLGMPSYNGLDDLLKLVGLSDTGNRKARNFSLGMRQRLGIAVALSGSPDFLILDEPVNGLDPQGIIEIRELILKLNREMGITVLISSHILDELSRIATHYGFIDGGRMIKEISAVDLEANCRKKTLVTVSDTAAFTRTLDKLHLDYRITGKDSAEIYDDVTVTGLSDAAKRENCTIFSMKERDESLESFYLNLVGGVGNVQPD